MNISDWQRKGREIICGNEVDYILSGILGLSRTELYLNSGEMVKEEKCREIFQALERRRYGMPVQYILGEVEFFSLPFILSPGVFIPRPETELLVEEAIKILEKNVIAIQHQQFGVGCEATKQSTTVLDICTGCGNIAVSLARNTHSKIVATDISDISLKIARENAVRLGVADSVGFLEGDMFEPLKRGNYSNFQLIISNPPYISSREWDSLPGEVKYYEPREALFGGEDGLDFYKRISEDAKRFIKKGGYLLLEAGPAGPVASILKQDGWQDIEIKKDYNSRERIISCRF